MSFKYSDRSPFDRNYSRVPAPYSSDIIMVRAPGSGSIIVCCTAIPTDPRIRRASVLRETVLPPAQGSTATNPVSSYTTRNFPALISLNGIQGTRILSG
jgi:hypothetical protein